MNNQEKIKRIKRLISNLTLIIALILIFFGGYNLFKIYTEEKEEKEQFDTAMSDFRDHLGSVDYVPKEDFVFSSDDINTIGIMTIEQLGIEAPIAWLDSEDPVQQEAVLQAYIGQDNSSSALGSPSPSNTIFYSHSSRYTCAHCFFNKLDTLKEGDIINILYYDNKEYNYIVYDVYSYLDPTAESYQDYLRIDKDVEKITLITCTGGFAENRTVVYAKRF